MKFNIRGTAYIFIDIFNSEKVTQNILLHEIGHVSFGHRHLDCRSSGWDRRQEREADRYMIEHRADEWLAQFDWEPDVSKRGVTFGFGLTALLAFSCSSN